jgi:hypothetical protein
VGADGTAYVTRCDVDDPATKIYGIYQVQIDLATGHLLTPDQLISTGYLLNNATARPEGPHGTTALASSSLSTGRLTGRLPIVRQCTRRTVNTISCSLRAEAASITGCPSSGARARAGHGRATPPSASTFHDDSSADLTTCSPDSPVVYNGIDPDPTTQPIQFTGHADLAQLPDGTWWSTLLGIRPQGGDIRRAPLGEWPTSSGR